MLRSQLSEGFLLFISHHDYARELRIVIPLDRRLNYHTLTERSHFAVDSDGTFTVDDLSLGESILIRRNANLLHIHLVRSLVTRQGSP